MLTWDTNGANIIINLKFSNGETLRIAYEHGLFDKTLNQYVHINASNFADFVGHEFYSSYYNGSEFIGAEIELVEAYVTTEFVRVFAPSSEWHWNVFANGVLTVPGGKSDGGAAGLFNIFELDENMKYDEEKMSADIEKYGLYTYEDFAEYLTEEEFNALPFAYLKVAVGKGNITWEGILEVIEDIRTYSN